MTKASSAPALSRRAAALYESERARARRAALARPDVFARLYLAHYFCAPPAPFHRELFARMADPSPGRRWAFAAPRGHAKSTLVTLAFPLWCACTGRRKVILIVSDTEPQAELLLEAIRHELDANAPLRRDFGDLRGPLWRADQLLLRNGVRLVAKGAGSGVRGLRSGPFRPDLLLCDDLENDPNTATPEQRRKVWDWFSRTLLNTLQPDGDAWVIGTLLHHDALLANLTAGNPERGIEPWPGRVWRALDERGRALWPAVWPAQKLARRRREIGSLAFAQEFLNRPCGPEEAVFQPDWLAAPAAWFDEPPASLDVFQAVDPAISRSSRADYFCHLTVGREPPTGDLYVLDIVRDRLTFEGQVATILEQAARWRPVRIGIEAVAYQAGLAEAVLSRAAVPIVRIAAPADKFTRAQRLSALIENAKVKLRRGDRRMACLRDELLQFPHGAHDDQVDALGYACDLALRPAAPRAWVL